MKTLLRLAGVRPAVDFVTPQLAIGGRARAWRLRRAGITHVLNVRITPDKPLPGITVFSQILGGVEAGRGILAAGDDENSLQFNRSNQAEFEAAAPRTLSRLPRWSMSPTSLPSLRRCASRAS